jgi:hypothetical protein
MSHRITYRSDIKDGELAAKALASLGYTYEESRDSLRITSGPMNRAVIDLKTGEVVGDSDFHSHDMLGGLRQAYSEAEVLRVMQRQGAQLETRHVLENGDVEILCRMYG